MGLKELRQSRGLTLEAVSLLAGIDPASVSRIERGLYEPRLETVVQLARGLGIAAKTMKAIIDESAHPAAHPDVRPAGPGTLVAGTVRHCKGCGQPLPAQSTGRPRRWHAACRRAAVGR